MFSPSHSTWKMVKDAPNYVPIHIIGLSQTSRKVLEDVDVPIFLVVLITLVSLHLSLHHHFSFTGIPLSIFWMEFDTIYIWPYVQFQRAIGQQDQVAIIQAWVWIDFHFSGGGLRVFSPNPISITELWNIPQFQCWNVSETPWTIWDSPRLDWNLIWILWLGLKINMLDVSLIESEKNQLSLIKSGKGWF